MTEEEKEKLKKEYDEIVKNFPYEKYQEIVDNYMKLFNHPSAQNGLFEYIKKNLLDKQNGR